MKVSVFAGSCAAVVVVVGSLVSAQTTSSRPEKTIKVTGYIATCDVASVHVVFVESPLPGRGQPRKFVSSPAVVGTKGRFTLLLDGAKASPGKYFIRYGRTKDTAMGSQLFTLKSEDADIGMVGGCGL